MKASFLFGQTTQTVILQENIPCLDDILSDIEGAGCGRALLVADFNTEPIARRIIADAEIPLCLLEAGEAAKNWNSVEKILKAACNAGLGRDGIFIGVGGGVVSDLTGFAASIYMRGARLALVSTTLLGMVDAALGGKTGFDLFGLKNLAGAFYPASVVFMPLESLKTLGEREFKSGFAELVKTVILDEAGDDEASFKLLRAVKEGKDGGALRGLVGMAINVKGRIVEADPRETGSLRALLNLGHTFGHALEASAGLGTLTHGEAVAWGIARACELGLCLGVTPEIRAARIKTLLDDIGYETRPCHPNSGGTAGFMKALSGDKKKTGGALRFIVPAARGAEIARVEYEHLVEIESLIKPTA
ncbi:MAG: 3-dehydroquinate synthase [Spirochaetaceae bacterium]|jgi:3-dehydroquinate synthase|nr:3-dehydroquinate synthase [Spirochaetaceae bacterium]